MGLRKLAHKIRRKLLLSHHRDSCGCSIATADRNYPTPIFDTNRTQTTSHVNLLGPAPAPIVPYGPVSIRRKRVYLDWRPEEARPLVVVNTPASELGTVSDQEPDVPSATPCNRLPELTFEGDFTAETLLESVPGSASQPEASPLRSESNLTLSASSAPMARFPSAATGSRPRSRDLLVSRTSTSVPIEQDPRSPFSFTPDVQLYDPFDPKRLEKEVIRLYRENEYQAKNISQLERACQAAEWKAMQLQSSKVPCRRKLQKRIVRLSDMNAAKDEAIDTWKRDYANAQMEIDWRRNENAGMMAAMQEDVKKSNQLLRQMCHDMKQKREAEQEKSWMLDCKSKRNGMVWTDGEFDAVTWRGVRNSISLLLELTRLVEISIELQTMA